MKSLLFITNGHGEDLVASEIIKLLPDDFTCTKHSLANTNLPSGGFSLRNFGFLAKDIKAGLIGKTLASVKVLKNFRGQFDLVVGVGDIVPIIGALMIKAPLVFVGVNKSSYYKTFGYGYTPWEKVLLRKYAQKVYVRDQKTEQNLKSWGIRVPKAEYVGNPLMDCVGEMTNDQIRMTNGGKTIIGFLPGTREDAKLNIEDFEKIAEKLKAGLPDAQFLIATKEESPALFQKTPFADLLAHSQLVIGLSGTGNEQAAGLGKPVVSFYGRGSQYNKRFALAQKELLGQALFLVPENNSQSVATAALQLLKDPAARQKMGATGQERMGHAGAVEKIAEYLRAC
ncbi:MAG: hypothetical protein ABH823_01430 [bacterium]